MTVRTSAKSRLMTPGRVIRSQMPCTPWRSTSSAMRNASTIETPRSSTSSRRSLGTTMSVSTPPCSASRPAWAASVRRLPSKPNGIVTMPTVSAPSSRATRAITGAAPVPVPRLAGGHEREIGPSQHLAQAVDRILGGLAAEIGVGTRAEPARQLAADLQLDARVRHRELLRVGVDRDELHSVDVGVDHALERVQAAAADADHADRGQVGGGLAARASASGSAGISGASAGSGTARRRGCSAGSSSGLGLGGLASGGAGGPARPRRARAAAGVLGQRLGRARRRRSERPRAARPPRSRRASRPRSPATRPSGGRDRPAGPRACLLYVCSRLSTSSASDR